MTAAGRKVITCRAMREFSLAGGRRVADGDGFGTAAAAFVLVKVDVVDHDCCW